MKNRLMLIISLSVVTSIALLLLFGYILSGRNTLEVWHSCVLVNGIILENNDGEKVFYTDESYGFFQTGDKKPELEFTYTGYYSLKDINSLVSNCEIVDGVVLYNKNSSILASDLPVNTKCYGYIAIKSNIKEDIGKLVGIQIYIEKYT